MQSAYQITVMPKDQSMSEILESFNELSEMERRVLQFRYGIGCPPYTVDEIHEKLCLNHQEIHRIELHALRRLRQLPIGVKS